MAIVQAADLITNQRVRVNDSGDSDMAFRVGANALWRFVSLRVHFSGSVAGGNDLKIVHMTRNDEQDFEYDAELFRQLNVGNRIDVGQSDVFVRSQRDEIDAWTFEPDESLIINWENSNPGLIAWGAVVTMIRGQIGDSVQLTVATPPSPVTSQGVQ